MMRNCVVRALQVWERQLCWWWRQLGLWRWLGRRWLCFRCRSLTLGATQGLGHDLLRRDYAVSELLLAPLAATPQHARKVYPGALNSRHQQHRRYFSRDANLHLPRALCPRDIMFHVVGSNGHIAPIENTDASQIKSGCRKLRHHYWRSRVPAGFEEVYGSNRNGVPLHVCRDLSIFQFR